MKTDAPLISILVCNYNYAQYIVESLDSALKQDYPHIEIVIIDDGSKDTSVEVIKKYIEDHPGHTIVFKPKKVNQGLCFSRNDAIDSSKGEYILFLDSDDILDEGYVSSLYAVAKEKSADVVYGDMRTFGDEHKELKFPEYNTKELLLHNYIGISSLINKQKIGDHRFDTKLNRKTLEDYDFWLGLSLMGLKFVKANNVYLNYRIQSASRNENSARLEDRILAFIYVWQYSIDKYKTKYPNKIPDDITVQELKYQIHEMGYVEEDLHRLNKEVHKDLLPNLRQKDEKVAHLEAKLKDVEGRYAALKNSLDNKLGALILKPLRTLKKAIKK